MSLYICIPTSAAEAAAVSPDLNNMYLAYSTVAFIIGSANLPNKAPRNPPD